MKKIAIIFAMQKEFDCFFQKLSNHTTVRQNHLTFYQTEEKNLQLCLCVSGIGKVNAAICTTNLIHFFKPDLIINIGVSGGLDSSLKIGDIVVADELAYHDVWCGTPCQLGQIYQMPKSYKPAYPELLSQYSHGLLISGDWFMTEAEKLIAVKQAFPKALAVDMESTAIAQTCYLYNTPFMVIRQISDVVGQTNEQEVYEAFWQNTPEQSALILQQVLTDLQNQATTL